MRRSRIWLAAVAADVVAVLLFAALGRRSHDTDSGVLAVVSTAAPFLVALAAGWVVVLVRRLPPMPVVTGVVLWAITDVGGLLLRRTVWDRGTAASFVIVASLSLGLLLVGWRGALSFTRGRGEIRSPSPPSKAGR